MKKTAKLELVKDIVATASILSKFGFDNITSNQSLFVEVLNELGFRTLNGNLFTKMNYRMLFSRLNPQERKAVTDEIYGMNKEYHVLDSMR